MRFTSVLLLFVSAWISGCRQDARDQKPAGPEDKPGARLANRDEIAKRLPGGLKLETRIPRDNWEEKRAKPDSRQTVEETLIEAKARIDKNGKLVDEQDREIVFETEVIPGKRPHPPKDKDDGRRSAEKKEREDYLKNRRVRSEERR